MKQNFPHQIFRAYDIRGIADEEVTTDFAYSLAHAYAALLPAQNKAAVVVARDVRLSGLRLQQAVMQGLQDAGVDVLDIGMVPTPLAYYGVHHRDAAGCIMVTASHNPAPYNGFKMMMGLDCFHGESIQNLKQHMLDGVVHHAATKGKSTTENIQAEYADFVEHDCVLKRPLKVVIDAGNGPSGVIAGPVYRALGCEVTELFCEPDGNFPNHHPDPTVEENMVDIAAKVRETSADLGIAFDGDGDRIGVVDGQGKMVWGDMLLLLLSRQLLETHPKATIISEVKSSQLLYDDIQAHGGNGIMWKTGHSPIKSKMKETNALLAGEMSGHFFFADRYDGFDDAVYAGARVMQVLAAQDLPLSALLSDLPEVVNTPEIRVDCPDDLKFDLVEQAKTHFAEQGYQMIVIDGMRLQLDEGWALLRASNTQPGLVLRFEASSNKALDTMQSLVQDWLFKRLAVLLA
ncbi:MAG: phosphomannomutase/phosphoglucomutase [Mariprofundaceae bacterium]|nr:phosphomannomutase/phosphoglucomutase [Mariprofundaceae bacterium]